MNKKILSILLCFTLLLSSITVFAEEAPEPEFTEIENSSTVSTKVGINVASTFQVIIPKTIHIDSTTNQGTYEINLFGDVAAKDIIIVAPNQNSIELRTYGSNEPITATVSQTKTSWLGTEVHDKTNPNTTTGTIIINNTLAGNWKTNMTFDIRLTEQE